MKWTRYGLTLSRLSESNIEMVRYWRNHPDVSKYMEHREYISPEMQQNWFNSINNAHNYFFIIEHQQQEVGLISTSNINDQIKTGNCGIFIWNEAAAGSHVPVFAVLSMLDFVFWVLALETTQIKVHQKNKKAIAYNRSLGYTLLPAEADNPFKQYSLTKANYFEKAASLRSLGKKLYGNSSHLYTGQNLPPLSYAAIQELNITHHLGES